MFVRDNIAPVFQREMHSVSKSWETSIGPFRAMAVVLSHTAEVQFHPLLGAAAVVCLGLNIYCAVQFVESHGMMGQFCFCFPVRSRGMVPECGGVGDTRGDILFSRFVQRGHLHHSDICYEEGFPKDICWCSVFVVSWMW